jgi:hypothetical protein
MIGDAYIDFTCDNCACDEQVSPPVVYSSMRGSDPHIDLREDALKKLLPKGWTMHGDQCYCEQCGGPE